MHTVNQSWLVHSPFISVSRNITQIFLILQVQSLLHPIKYIHPLPSSGSLSHRLSLYYIVVHSVILSQNMTNKSPLSFSDGNYQLYFCFHHLQHFHIRHPFYLPKKLTRYIKKSKMYSLAFPFVYFDAMCFGLYK